MGTAPAPLCSVREGVHEINVYPYALFLGGFSSAIFHEAASSFLSRGTPDQREVWPLCVPGGGISNVALLYSVSPNCGLCN